MTLPGQLVSNLDSIFASDDEGAGVLADFCQAAETWLQAQSEHEQWQRAEYAKRQKEERDQKEKEEKRLADEQLHTDIQWALGAISGSNRREVDNQKFGSNEKPIGFVEQPEDRFARLKREEHEAAWSLPWMIPAACSVCSASSCSTTFTTGKGNTSKPGLTTMARPRNPSNSV